MLSLDQKELGDIIGLSEASVSRMAHQSRWVEIAGKEGEMALLFIRMIRSLSALLGGRETEMQKWFNGFNSGLGGIPRELIKTIRGLLNVSEYLDAMRGKV